mgnify:CR=1 FL=1
MRYGFLLLLACGGLLLLQGCLRAPVVPPYGIVYSEFQAPLYVDFNATPVATKSGQAESMSILGLIATGDASAKAAAAQGGITKIEHADYYYFNVLGVVQRYRTIVYGE